MRCRVVIFVQEIEDDQAEKLVAYVQKKGEDSMERRLYHDTGIHRFPVKIDEVVAQDAGACASIKLIQHTHPGVTILSEGTDFLALELEDWV